MIAGWLCADLELDNSYIPSGWHQPSLMRLINARIEDVVSRSYDRERQPCPEPRLKSCWPLSWYCGYQLPVTRAYALGDFLIGDGNMTEEIIKTDQHKTRFNWWAFLFGAYYYAANEKIGSAIIMMIIGFLPITRLFVCIYAGFRAKHDITKKSKTNWRLVVFLLILDLTLHYLFIQYTGS